MRTSETHPFARDSDGWWRLNRDIDDPRSLGYTHASRSAASPCREGHKDRSFPADGEGLTSAEPLRERGDAGTRRRERPGDLHTPCPALRAWHTWAPGFTTGGVYRARWVMSPRRTGIDVAGSFIPRWRFNISLHLHPNPRVPLGGAEVTTATCRVPQA